MLLPPQTSAVTSASRVDSEGLKSRRGLCIFPPYQLLSQQVTEWFAGNPSFLLSSHSPVGHSHFHPSSTDLFSSYIRVGWGKQHGFPCKAFHARLHSAFGTVVLMHSPEGYFDFINMSVLLALPASLCLVFSAFFYFFCLFFTFMKSG